MSPSMCLVSTVSKPASASICRAFCSPHMCQAPYRPRRARPSCSAYTRSCTRRRKRPVETPGQCARRGDIATQILPAWSQRTCDTAQYQVWTGLVVYGVEGRDEVVLLGSVEGGGIEVHGPCRRSTRSRYCSRYGRSCNTGACHGRPYRYRTASKESCGSHVSRRIDRLLFRGRRGV